MIPTPQHIGFIYTKGMASYLNGCALTPNPLTPNHELLYLSCIGRSVALRSHWATVMARKPIAAHIETTTILIPPADVKYCTIQTRLPDSGYFHLLILHPQATFSDLVPGQDIYLIHDSSTPPYARFIAMLDQAINIPIKPDWGPYLWSEGTRLQHITPLPHTWETCHAWHITINSPEAEHSANSQHPTPWADIIQGGIEDGHL